MGFWSSVGNAVSSGLGAVGDAVETTVNTVADAVEDGVDAVADTVEGAVDTAVTWIDEHGGPILGGAACVLGGLINGLFEGARDLVHDVVNVVKDVGAIAGSFLRFDFGGVIRGIVNLVIDAVDLLVDAVRFVAGGYFVGGIVAQFEREALRKFVKELLDDRFAADSALRNRIRDKLRVTSADWGLRMDAGHQVLMLDSANTPLWQWHNEGTIDLFAMAGIFSSDSFQVQRPRTWVRVVGADGTDNLFPVNRWVIADYLDSSGANRRLRVYAMDKQALAERIDVATDKCHKLGLRLSWNHDTAFYGGMFPSVEIMAKDEYSFLLSKQGRFVVTHGLRTGARPEDCVLLGVGAFQLDPPRFGNTGGRDIVEGSAAAICATPGRTDSCCVVLPVPAKLPEGSSVVHRDFWPGYVFRYVLAHEIGHYMGLCHHGHDGFQNIMYTKADGAELSAASWGLFKFYYQSEPAFTLADGKNSWRFIVDQLGCCLDGTLACGSRVGSVRAEGGLPRARAESVAVDLRPDPALPAASRGRVDRNPHTGGSQA